MRTQKSYSPYYWCVTWVNEDGRIEQRGNATTFGGIVEWAQDHLEELPELSEIKYVNKRSQQNV